MDVHDSVGIQLTESLAMLPAASVCGLYMAHPKAIYFSLGKITREQASMLLLTGSAVGTTGKGRYHASIRVLELFFPFERKGSVQCLHNRL